MYIIELFIKIKEEFKKNGFKKQKKPEKKEYEACSHFFVPIDSTGRILACSKCGMLYKLKKNETNPFKQDF